MLKRLQVESKFVNGLRVADDDVMDVSRWCSPGR